MHGKMTRRQPRWYTCPICGVKILNAMSFVDHMLDDEYGGGLVRYGDVSIPFVRITCWCGQRFDGSFDLLAAGKLARHLAGVKDIQAHWALGALRKM